MSTSHIIAVEDVPAVVSVKVLAMARDCGRNGRTADDHIYVGKPNKRSPQVVCMLQAEPAGMNAHVRVSFSNGAIDNTAVRDMIANVLEECHATYRDHGTVVDFTIPSNAIHVLPAQRAA